MMYSNARLIVQSVLLISNGTVLMELMDFTSKLCLPTNLTLYSRQRTLPYFVEAALLLMESNNYINTLPSLIKRTDYTSCKSKCRLPEISAWQQYNIVLRFRGSIICQQGLCCRQNQECVFLDQPMKTKVMKSSHLFLRRAEKTMIQCS